MIMSHGYNAAAIPAGYPVAGGYGHHPHQLQQYHPHHHYSAAAAAAAAAQDAGAQPKMEPGARPGSPSAAAAASSSSDPFSPSGCGFGAEDEFDVPPLPPTAMEDPQQPPPPTQPQHYKPSWEAVRV